MQIGTILQFWQTAAFQIVVQTEDIMHKVKSTIRQAQNNRLSTELLRGDTIIKYLKSASEETL
jgi:hypothetical protein